MTSENIIVQDILIDLNTENGLPKFFHSSDLSTKIEAVMNDRGLSTEASVINQIAQKVSTVLSVLGYQKITEHGSLQ